MKRDWQSGCLVICHVDFFWFQAIWSTSRQFWRRFVPQITDFRKLAHARSLSCDLIATFPQSVCWARSTKFFPIKDTNLEVRQWKRWGRQHRRRIKGIYSLAFTWNDTRFREYLNYKKELNGSTYPPKIYRKLDCSFKIRKVWWRRLGGGQFWSYESPVLIIVCII